MNRSIRLPRASAARSIVVGVLCSGMGLWLVPCHAAAAQAEPKRRTQAELAVFMTHVEEFAALHRKLEATLPKLPKDATPEQIDRDQRGLAALISSNRATARPGDIFTPATQSYVRSLMKRIFRNFDRRKLRETIEDENPRGVRVAVNGRYPDEVPLASMPAEVLQALPALPDELEYRFVGDTLILLDAHAHLVVDLMPNALPK